MREDQMLMATVAELYYVRDFTQQEIADRVGCSRPTVSRLLRRSRDTGVVRIEVVPPNGAQHGLARELEQTFGLREALVVGGQSESPTATRAALGVAAARYLDRYLKGGERIGVSWGTTLDAVITRLRPRRLGTTVVPLVGGVGQASPGIHANDLARRMASIHHGRVHLLHAPAVVANGAVRDALLSDPRIRAVLTLVRKVDLALVGIGALVRSSTLIQTGYFSIEDFAQLRKRGAVGDVCTRPFTKIGVSADEALARRIVAVELDDLRRIPTVIGIAGGLEKATAIFGAVHGGLVKVLVTDQAAAQAILQMAGAPLGVSR